MLQTFRFRLLPRVCSLKHSGPRRFTGWALRRWLVVLIGMSGHARAAGDDSALPGAIQFSDLDLKLTRQFRDGTAEEVDPYQLRRTLGLDPTVAPWGFAAPAGETPVEFL